MSLKTLKIHPSSTFPKIPALLGQISREPLGIFWVCKKHWKGIFESLKEGAIRFWSDLKRTSYSQFSRNIIRLDNFLHKLCKLAPWIGQDGNFYLGFVLLTSIPFHRALIHVSTTIFSEVENFDMMLRRHFQNSQKKGLQVQKSLASRWISK